MLSQRTLYLFKTYETPNSQRITRYFCILVEQLLVLCEMARRYRLFINSNLVLKQGSVLSPFLFAIYPDAIIDYRLNGQNCYVILFADDILLIVQYVTELQRYLLICESELLWLGMSINIKKYCCMQIGPRHDATYTNIITTSGLGKPWGDEIRYLGVHLISAKLFKCNFD